MRVPPAIVISALLSACGGGGSPAAPTSSADVAGTWESNVTLASVSGGECAGAALQAAVGRRDILTTAIQQSGSALSAKATSEGNGTACSFTGSASAGTISLGMTSCQGGRISGVQCANGAVRDLQIVSESIGGSFQNGAGTGSDTSTWNVLPSGGTTPLGVLTLNATFTWIQLGLPASNFHNFTGTIEPGYQDGVITIGPPEPFCTQCGWFR